MSDDILLAGDREGWLSIFFDTTMSDKIRVRAASFAINHLRIELADLREKLRIEEDKTRSWRRPQN